LEVTVIEKTKWRDTAWKEIISDCPRSAIEYLMPDLAADMKPVRKLDGISGRELFSKGSDSDKHMLVNDIFFKIPMLDGESGNIAFFLEQQHEPNMDLPRRVFETYIRLREKLRLRTTCIVIYTGSSPNVSTYAESCYGFKVAVEFRTYCLPEKNVDELRADNRPFAPVMLAGRLSLDAGNDIRLREKYAAEILKTTPKSEERMFIIDFSRRIFKLDDPEISYELRKEYKMETIPLEEYRKQIKLENARLEGIEEGIEEGREKGMEKAARSMLARGTPLKEVAETLGLAVDRVQKLKPH
jgi:predicted transposase YdaD